jgi:hypothetical protein
MRMPSRKHLKGAAYDIMHHAVSSMSWLHPHIAQTCRTAGLVSLTLDLMRESPLPPDVPAERPCILATQNLHRTFVALLEKLGFSLADVTSATLTFSAPRHARDDYTLPCRSELVTTDGKRYEHQTT